MTHEASASGRHDPWRRVESAGGFVPIGRTISSDAGEIEIVKTYADCSVTALFFRAPPDSMVMAGMPMLSGILASVLLTPYTGLIPNARITALAVITIGAFCEISPKGRSPIIITSTSIFPCEVERA